MVPQWLRSPIRSNSAPRSPSHFHFSSFKDIDTLLNEDPEAGHGSGCRKKLSIFHRVRLSASVIRAWAHRPAAPPDAEERVVIYFTSLHVIRKTFEDCRTVRSILRGFRVPIDERDLSMDDKFLEELQRIVGRKSVALPMVFIGGKYVGGAEEVSKLHESGELKKMIAGLPVAAAASGCESCGGLRFVVCERCNGSRKIYSEKLGFRICNACNVNGLTSCPSCSPTLHRHSQSFS